MSGNVLFPTRQPVADTGPRRARIIGVACGSGARDHGCEDGPGMLHALESVHADRKLLALEVVEYNSHRDNNYETAQAVRELCKSLLD
jgi:arginase family enzyme